MFTQDTLEKAYISGVVNKPSCPTAFAPQWAVFIYEEDTHT